MADRTEIPHSENRPNASIVDVARLAGVSSSTAARVFREGQSVHPQTRGKVLQAAELLNYVPNMLARGLRGGSTNMIGILWSQTGDPVVGLMMHKLVGKLTTRKYLTNILDTLNVEVVVKSIEDYANRGFDALVLQSFVGLIPGFQSLLSRFKAVLLVAPEYEPSPFDTVIVDRLDAYRAVARHFALSGRQKVAFATPFLPPNKGKYLAFKEELLNHNIVMPCDNLIETDYSIETFEPLDKFVEVLNNRFRDAFPFDSVICTNDETAQVLMHWLIRKGYKIPDDVAVVGFNNSVMCPYLNPPLASIDRRMDETVQVIDKLLMKRLNNPDAKQQIETLKMEFFWRASAGSKHNKVLSTEGRCPGNQ